MIFARLAVISLIILNSEVIKGNEISGTFQVCNLQCSNEGETSPPVSDNILRASTLLRGKSGPRGDKGNIGHTGAKGALGEKGEDGRQGVKGSQGGKGEVGRQGLKGEDGTSSNETLIEQLNNRITELESDATMIQQLQTRITQLEGESDVMSKSLRPQNCAQIKEQNPEATTGKYRIYKHLFSDGEQVTCAMTSEGSVLQSKNCNEILELDPSSTDGVYAIQINPSTTINVYCDMTGGAWTVFQKRFDGSENFRRNFNEYSEGFGDPSQEHWLGLNNIHQLTSQPGRSVLRVDLETFGGETAYAQYEVFNVGAGTDYTLSIGSYSGNAGNSMEHHNGARFSTYDRDQDGYSGDCSNLHNGAWWFTSDCGYSNLNAFVYNDERHAKGMVWYHLKKSWTKPMKTTTMKMKTI